MKNIMRILMLAATMGLLVGATASCGTEASTNGSGGGSSSAAVQQAEIESCERMGECDESFDVAGCIENAEQSDDDGDDRPDCDSEFLDFHDCSMELECEDLVDPAAVGMKCGAEADDYAQCIEDKDEPNDECAPDEILIDLDGSAECFTICDDDGQCASDEYCAPVDAGDDIDGVCIPEDW